MGRELKRVPLDFSWPLNKVWDGYINHEHRPCPEDGQSCFDGYTGGARWLERILRLLTTAAMESRGISSRKEMLARQEQEQKRSRIYPHPYLRNMPNAPYSLRPGADILDSSSYEITPITEDLVQLIERITGKSTQTHPHDDEPWDLRDHLLQAAGVPSTWGQCPVCNGDCVDPAVKDKVDAWQRTNPPTGSGFQLWGTTNEGSPLSPVFATLDELCAWCEPNATTFADFRASAAEWKVMFEAGMVVHREGNMVFL